MSAATGPETDLSALARCAVDDPAERCALLRALVASHELVTLHAAGDADCFVVSTVLAVDAGHDRIDLEFKTDDARVDAFRRAGAATAVALSAGVKLQFVLERFTIAGDPERARLRAPLPDALWRMQRRDAYRVAPHPLARPRLWIGDDATATELRVVDVSATGVAFALPAHRPSPTPGERLGACRLELPSNAPIRCSLRVRAVDAHDDGVRVGCELEGLDPSAARAVQVFVNLSQTRGRRARPRLG